MAVLVFFVLVFFVGFFLGFFSGCERDRIRAIVTADVLGDVRPVMNATVRYGALSVTTDAGGEAMLPIDSGEGGDVVATAGNRFVPATASVADARVGEGLQP